MASTQLFRRAHGNLPPLFKTPDPGEALRPTLLELAEFYTKHVQVFPEASRRLVCDFSNNNFSLQHVEALAQWLQKPTTSVKIYALDLSFNRIQCPSWEAFVPLVNSLSKHVQHLDFGGNYLPPLLESDNSLKLLHSNVSLSVSIHSPAGHPWVDSWAERSKHFQELAYGFSQPRW